MSDQHSELATPVSDRNQPGLKSPQIEILPPHGATQPMSNGSPMEIRAPAVQPTARKVGRNGKIARLPKLYRDLVNQMLRNNIPHSKISGALEEYDIRVTVRNISNWKTRGGYKDWCFEQDRAVQVRLLQDNLTDFLRQKDASQVPEVGLQLVATYFSEFLLTPEARQQLATDPEKYSRMIASLCRLAHQIHTLQKYRDDSARELGLTHSPERLKREAESQVETTRGIYSAEKLGASVNEYDIPHRNHLPKP